MAESGAASSLGEALAGNHEGRGNAVRGKSAIECMVAYPCRGRGDRKSDHGLVELHPGPADHSGPTNQHKGRLGRYEEG